MTARLLVELDARSSAASDLTERLVLRAERAGVLARLGRIGEARSEIAALRDLNPSYSPRLAAWILFSEGLVEHFDALAPSARDRFSRAHAISQGIGDTRLLGRSAAWIGYWDFRGSNYRSAVQRAEEALMRGDGTDNFMLSRTWLLIADMCELAGMGMGPRYFSRARGFAVAEGDIGMQSVVLFNSVGHSLSKLTICDAFDLSPVVDGKLVELELGSIANLDSCVGILDLQVATRLCQAQLATCKKDWISAKSLYEQSLDDARRRGHERWRSKYLAEAALCSAQLGELGCARTYVDESLQCLELGGDADDLAIANARISATLRCLGMRAQADARFHVALECLGRFRNEQRELADLMKPLVAQYGAS